MYFSTDAQLRTKINLRHKLCFHIQSAPHYHDASLGAEGDDHGRHDGIWDSGGVAPPIHWVVSFTSQPLYTRGNSPLCLCYSKLGRPQSRSGRFREDRIVLPLPGIGPRSGLQHCHHTDRADGALGVKMGTEKLWIDPVCEKQISKTDNRKRVVLHLEGLRDLVGGNMFPTLHRSHDMWGYEMDWTG